MNMKELVESVSSSTGVGRGAVKKVLSSAFTTLSEKMAGEAPLKLQGLGTFARKAGKKEGKSRVVFKPWPTEEQKQAKKEKRQAKKAEAAG